MLVVKRNISSGGSSTGAIELEPDLLTPDEITSVSIKDATESYKAIGKNSFIIKAAKNLGIALGD